MFGCQVFGFGTVAGYGEEGIGSSGRIRTRCGFPVIGSGMGGGRFGFADTGVKWFEERGICGRVELRAVLSRTGCRRGGVFAFPHKRKTRRKKEFCVRVKFSLAGTLPRD